MASRSSLHLHCLLLLATLMVGFGSITNPGVASVARPCSNGQTLMEAEKQGLKGEEEQWIRWREKNGRRLLIGSRAPTCTYNECRGCRHRCSAEEVPVDASDPMNSAYHYRCVCHL